MNVPRKLTIVPEMVESVRTLRILTRVVAQSTIWMCRSIVRIVQAENANDVSFSFFYYKNWEVRKNNKSDHEICNKMSIYLNLLSFLRNVSVIDECQTGQNDCSLEAICTDTEDSYECACPTGYIDVSPDIARKPGRRCLLSKLQKKELLENLLFSFTLILFEINY